LVRDSPLDAAALAGAKDRGTTVIAWRDPRGELKPLTAGLYQAARGGTWNHLVLPLDEMSPLASQLLSAFAAENPGIIHSWCRQAPAASLYSGPRHRYPRGSAAYGRTMPLPGVPVWQVLRHPELIAVFVRRQGLASLAQSRLDPDKGILFELGRICAIHVKRMDTR